MSHVLKYNVADQIAYFRAYDTDGTAKTDLTSATTGLTLSVFRVGASSVSIASLSDKAADDSTHADGAIRSVGGNLYTIDIPDAATATQVPSVVVRGSYTGGVVEGLEHPIVAYNPAVAYSTGTPLDAAGIRTAVGLASANLDTQLGTIDTVVDGTYLQVLAVLERLPAALVGGRIDASVGAMANNVITAAAMATDASAEIADAVWDEAYAGHTTAGTFGKLMDTIRKSNLSIDGEVTSAITPTTLTFSSNVSATSSAYAHAVLLFVSGPLAGENSPIISYNSTNGVFLLEEELTAAPSAGDEFVIIAGSHVHSVVDIQAGLATSAELTEIKGATWSSSTDTLEAIRDASGGGGGTVIVAPIQAEVPPRSVETLLRAYRGETVDQIVSVVESDGTTPVDLSGKSLEIVFEGYLGTDLAVIATANITVSGDDNNVVTFAYPSAVTATVGRYYWSLRDDAAPSQVYLNGEVEVLRAAVNDP